MSLNKKEPKLDTEKYNRIVIYAGVRDWSDCTYSMDNGEHWIKSEEFSEEESEKFIEIFEQKFDWSEVIFQLVTHRTLNMFYYNICIVIF